MQGLQPSVFLAMALAFVSLNAAAQPTLPPLDETVTPAYRAVLREDSRFELLSGPADSFEPLRISAPGASYIRIHFGRFSLPDGVVVEISNADRTEVYRYANGKLDGLTLDRQRGDDGVNRFYAMSVTGDTAVIRLHGRLDRFDPARHGVLIDSWLEGPGARFTSGKNTEDSQLESTCGVNERRDAKCYADTHPGEYDRSIPVALLITSTGEECTAWRVGPDNHMFTAEHCVSAQSDLDGSELWFHYRAESCGSSAATQPVKVTGGQLLAKDDTLDYTLFSVNDFASIAYLGHLGLDVRNGVQGEGIFIPQHGLGKPKQIALESDMNVSGLCEIDDDDYDGYAAGSNLGYFCDTTTSSSGSPVIARATGKVIALHHLGGCFNSGSKVALIWPQVSAHFGGVVPQGDNGSNWDAGNQLPQAHFSFVCDGLACNFDGSGSDDSDGDIEAWSWNFGDGATASGMTAEHEFSAAGTFTVRLNVEDDEGATDSYSKSVTVALPNQGPTAQFSIQCQDNVCNFNGAASTDTDGQVVSWNWKFGDGGIASGAQATHSYAAAGSYSIILTVKDDDGASDSRSNTVTVNMPNQAPLADFTVHCDGLECSADATGSADPDGDIVGYHWDLGDGASAAGAAISHSYGDAGTFTVTLTVEDDEGATASSSRSVTVQGPEPEPEPPPPPPPQPEPPEANQLPEARFTSDCELNRCSFDARASSDGDGQISAWRWSFGDGHTATGATVEHDYSAAGRYQVALTVEDDQGATDARKADVDVTLPDAEPVAEFSVDCDSLNCTLDAGSSTDDEGRITSYDWAFGDGNTGQGRTVTHEYEADGVYQVTLKVIDGDTLSSTRTRTVEVISARQIALNAAGSRLNGGGVAVLKWSRASTDTVIVLRNGKQIAEVANSGKYLDKNTAAVRKSARYQVCDARGGNCSEEVTVLFATLRNNSQPANKAPYFKINL
jgi:PKD repeat protein